MSDRPIQVGDLVVVTKPSACPKAPMRDDLGLMFRVRSISPASGCHWCGPDITHTTGFRAEGPKFNYAFFRIKRIPPLEELESNDLCHPMKEPA